MDHLEWDVVDSMVAELEEDQLGSDSDDGERDVDATARYSSRIYRGESGNALTAVRRSHGLATSSEPSLYIAATKASELKTNQMSRAKSNVEEYHKQQRTNRKLAVQTVQMEEDGSDEDDLVASVFEEAMEDQASSNGEREEASIQQSHRPVKVRVQQSPTAGSSPTSSASTPPLTASDSADEFDRAVKIAHQSPESASSPSSNIQRARHNKETVESLKSFVNQPVGERELTRCVMTRKRHFFGAPTYYLYLEKDGQYLMCTRKRVASKTSNYLITLDTTPTERGNPLNVGKVRGDWGGFHYTVYNEGISPEDTVSFSCLRKELGVVRYNVGKHVRQAVIRDVVLPKVSKAGVPSVIRPRSESESIMSKLETEGSSSFDILRNEVPVWDDNLGAYVLHFEDRRSRGSVKNFRLSRRNDHIIALQFGRLDRDKFTLDFRYPLTPLQAFAIVLSTLDSKATDRN
eukprot:gb/GECG01016778.1/.p1 GENE.gb/GECG01016778.1/~~gb/GECG01016778.1/.p1  ORF type:complete len:462 (+),score=62.71 gb/GECG01016778.1/:1-1386(+)